MTTASWAVLTLAAPHPSVVGTPGQAVIIGQWLSKDPSLPWGHPDTEPLQPTHFLGFASSLPGAAPGASGAGALAVRPWGLVKGWHRA